MADKKKKTKESNQGLGAEPFYKKYLYQIIIGAFIFALYANSIGNNYNMDDGLVTHNHKYTSLGFAGIPKIITSPYYSDDQGYAYDYRPVVHLSFAIENQLFGDNPHVGHFFNIVLYMLCCLVLFGLLRKLLNVPDWICLAGVLIFAAHPVHTEVVCSLKNRDELLSMLFAFLAFNIYRRYYENGKWYFLLGGLLLISVSFLSKLSSASYAAIIPVALLLLKGQKPVRAVLISLLTATMAALIQPSVTLGNKINTLLLLLVPVLVIIVIQNFSSILLAIKTRFKNMRGTIVRRIKARPEVKGKKLEPELKTEGLIAESEWGKEGIIVWGQWKPYVLNILLLAIGFGSLFFGSLLGIYAISIALMALFLFGKNLYKWLAFWSVGLYMCCLFFVFSQLRHYFEPAVAIFFLIYILHPLKYYKVTAALFFTGLVVLSKLFGDGMQYGLMYALPLSALIFIKKKYEAYFQLIFSSSAKLLGVIIIAALIGDTVLNRYASDGRFTGGPNRLDLFYNGNSNGIHETIKLAQSSSAKLHATSDKLKDAGQKIKQAQGKVAETKIEVLPVATDRPLLFIEAPVAKTDPLNIRVGTSLVVLLHYAKLMMFPYPLSFYYGYRIIEPTPANDWKAITGLLIYLCLGIVALVNVKRDKILSLGLFAYLLGVAMFINFSELIPGVVGDRYLLFPSVGFCIIIIAIIHYYAEKKKLRSVTVQSLPIVFKYGFGALLLLLSIETWSRNLDWKDNLTLFRHDLKYVTQSAQGHNLLALQLFQRSSEAPNREEQENMRREAVEEFKASLNIYPLFFNVNFDLGRTYALLKVPDSALIYFKKGIALNPTYNMSHLAIADIYMQRSNWQQAIPYLQQAVALRPKDYNGYDKLSYAYFMLKDFANAIQTNKTAMAEIPGNAEPVINIGRTYEGMRQSDSARYYLKKADSMAPGNPLVQQILKQLGD